MANYSFAKSWMNIPIGARLIRLFLGVTFIYGGWNKATDPGFLNPQSASYIGAQITSYLDTSPISFALKPMIENATAFGWSIIIAEFAIGIATLAGIALELAALGGFFLSITLWLTATWTVKPYFLGSDTAYAILWLALFLLVRQNTKGRRVIALLPDLGDRREVIRILGVAAASVAAVFVGRRFENSNPTPEAGTAIAKTADFPIGSTKEFVAADGSPAMLFRTKAGVFAYSRICTHQGCSVTYDEKANLLICPCHGARFDPSNSGAAVSGPIKIPLPKINVAIKGINIVQI
ncbi:MAG: Rieske 2Fe-2S domain-containing protein [Actinomycetes bacterium]